MESMDAWSSKGVQSLDWKTGPRGGGGRCNIKMSFYQYRDPHVKDKTVSRSCNFNIGIPISYKDGLYFEALVQDISSSNSHQNGLRHCRIVSILLPDPTDRKKSEWMKLSAAPLRQTHYYTKINNLTHLALDKLAAISQTIFSDAFPWMKKFVFWLKFHWSLSLRVQLTRAQHWFR